MMVIEVEYIISGVKVKVKDSEAKWQVQMVMSCSHYVVSSTFGLIKVEVTIIHNHKHHLPSSSDAILSLTWMALFPTWMASSQTHGSCWRTRI